MALKYKVKDRYKLDGSQLYIEAIKVKEVLDFDDYIKEVNDPFKTHTAIENYKLKWVFHPKRDYTFVRDNYRFYRLEDGYIYTSDKERVFTAGDYIMYDVCIDDFEKWDPEDAKKYPALELVHD